MWQDQMEERHAAQAAEPPSDLMLNLPPTEADKAGLDAWSEGYARGADEAKRDAVGLLKALLENPWPPYRQETFAAMSTARAYIAAFEAEQEKGE